MTTQLQYGMAGDRPYGLYYEHSGRTPVGSVIVASVAGAAAAVVAGIIYGYLIEFVPYIKLRLVVTMGFGALVGWVTARIAKAGKVRSLTVGLSIVGTATLVGYYVCWVVWIKAMLDEIYSGQPKSNARYSDLILAPGFLWHWVMRINQFGIWRMSKSDTENVKGIFLTLIWLGEAAGIFGCSLFVALHVLREEMFCEACNRWCGKAANLRRVVIGDPIRLRQTLEAHDFSYLDTLEPTAGDRHWDVSHDYCTSCKRLHAVSVKQNIITRNKRGTVAGRKKSTIINRLLLDETEAEALRKGPAAAGGGDIDNTPGAPPPTV